MTFIPSIFLSIPQVVLLNSGATGAISSVNTAYSRITILGWKGNNAGGTVSANRFAVRFNSSIEIEEVSSAGGSAYVLIEEFHPRFFRQAIQHDSFDIANGATSASHAHGLSLGTKAFAVFRGSKSNRAADAPLALAESQVLPTMRLNGANIDASNVTAPYAGGDGTITIYYSLLDPK